MAARLMEASVDSNFATCPTCGTLIDVSDEEPYAKIHCSSCGTAMRVRQAFAHFEITGLLGEGGQGLVYRATDKKLKRSVAIKLMRRQYSADPVFVKRFESEARVTASLNHPNVVKVFSFGKNQGLLYLAMEMVDQGSLDAVMGQLGTVPEERVLEVGIQIAKGLKAGLEKGLIHRDIKPGNILFADEHTAKIVDFGLAVLIEKQNEEDGDVWATPYYVSPEKLDDQPEDFRSDMYSLAATLFHALAGRPPFLAETNSIRELRKIKSKPVHLQSFAPHASNPTTYVIEKALAVKPEDRWASYDDFIENLEYARNEFRKRPKTRMRTRVMESKDDRSGSWITICVILLVIAAGVVFVLKRNGSAGTNAKAPPPATQGKNESEAATVRYNEARFRLLKGRFRPAAAELRELYGEAKLPEPQHSWCGFNAGLAELLDGRPAPARNFFAALGNTMAEMTIGMDPEMIGFFKRFGALATEKDIVTLEDAGKFNKANYEAIALLALALKNWEAGSHADAVTLFRQFQAAEPTGSSAWVMEYRPLVAPYLEEYGAFTSLVQDLKNYETAPERAEKALQNLPEFKDKLRSVSLRGELKKVEEGLAPTVASGIATAKEAAAKKMAEMEAADEKALTEAKKTIKKFCEDYRFGDAHQTIKRVDVKLEKHIADRDLLLKRVEWLVHFKRELIKDLTTGGGYNGPLYRKNGTTLPGGVASASETHLSIRIGAGSAMVQWHEVTPASVLAMAKSFFRPTLPPAELAARQWRAGVFCIFTELAECEALMGEAAAVSEEYRLHKALFFNQPTESAPAPAPAPQAPSAETPKPADAAPAPGTGLEMLKDPLNPNKKNADENLIKGLRRPGQ
jgi:eukaryotic-like serine/threonine-protein kinase